jgi:nucleoid DNA-binding protein
MAVIPPQIMANFTKKEIIQEISDELGVTQALSSKMLHLVVDIVSRELARSKQRRYPRFWNI